MDEHISECYVCLCASKVGVTDPQPPWQPQKLTIFFYVTTHDDSFRRGVCLFALRSPNVWPCPRFCLGVDFCKFVTVFSRSLLCAFSPTGICDRTDGVCLDVSARSLCRLILWSLLCFRGSCA